ncbi:MAG: type II CRISPR RNA-guided endonuclease Cas9, partial [Clostridia bacterium]|nr:type II CRISPR RNA-guided endonuclease Cas9 [Clostridia bacterium]
GIENGLIPYQLQMRELKEILKNASAYLPFLNAVDPDGYTVAEKILKTFEFRLPYYVGPLKQDNGQKKYTNHWCVRFAGKEQTKIEPWNFEEVVDLEKCAAAFMANLVGFCQYTGEPVLPKDSLLYSEYMLRNELNPLRVNGQFLPPALREQMIDELFIHSERARTVSKRDIFNFLRRNGYSIQSKDEITGIDDKIKTVLKSRHDFARLLNRTGDYGLAEEMIHSILVFGEDKKLLRRRLKALAPDLDEADLRYFCQRKYTEWGNLSEYLLTGMKAEIDGEQKTVMDMLREKNLVLMQILSQEYPFGKLAQSHLDETLGNKTSLSDKLDALYVSPAVERAIRQALKIVDEVVGIRKAPPEKIFIEVARDVNGKNQKQRTSSRKEQLQALYRSCKEQGHALSRELEERLAAETDDSLRNDRLFLYYRQNGKDMYTGKPMELEEVLAGKRYDRDHIFPRSIIKDDSLDNLVLVNSRDNREKTNDYPLKEEIRARMLPEWTAMRKRGQISEKTYSRLT